MYCPHKLGQFTFAKDVLKVNNFDSNNYTIAREEKNIDLFISSPTHCFIIENKIRSTLIKENRSMAPKLKDYFPNQKQKVQEFSKIFEAKDYYYQTDRYFAYANSLVATGASNAQIKGYVLFPNYAQTTILKELKDTLFSQHYSPITYRDVYEFFCKLKACDWLSNKERIYLDEFIWAMEKHTKDIDNIFEDEMKYRFYKKIQNS